MKSTIPLLVRSSPYPEKVKNFTLDDLYHNPVGQKIGKGCIQYIEVMTVPEGDSGSFQGESAHASYFRRLVDTGPKGPWQK